MLNSAEKMVGSSNVVSGNERRRSYLGLFSNLILDLTVLVHPKVCNIIIKSRRRPHLGPSPGIVSSNVKALVGGFNQEKVLVL